MKYRPKSLWCDEIGCEVVEGDRTVYEIPDGTPTGLLNGDGLELYRYDRTTMGFSILTRRNR